MFEKTTDSQLTGSVVNGRVLLDPLGSDPLGSDPVLNSAECAVGVSDPSDPGGAFGAVNAPFDPQSVAVETEEPVEA